MTAHNETFTKGDAKQLAAAAKLIFHFAPDIRPILPEIHVPTLILAGQHDKMYALADQQAAAHALPNGTFVALNAAHIAAVDAAKAVERELVAAWGD